MSSDERVIQVLLTISERLAGLERLVDSALHEAGGRLMQLDQRLALLGELLAMQAAQSQNQVDHLMAGLETYFARSAAVQEVDRARRDRLDDAVVRLLSDTLPLHLSALVPELPHGAALTWSVDIEKDPDLGGRYIAVDVRVTGITEEELRSRRLAFTAKILSSLPPALRELVVVTVKADA